MKKQTEIAMYGKGGIGKSTVSANLSVALAEAGRRVLQIGCDPKHDSTRLLLGGRTIPTVLEHLRDVPKEQADIRKVLAVGTRGIGCLEAGGPRPGVGCAGRGIISAFEFLEKSRAKEDYDTVVYDVLGDVVCGGFAVPIRREYSDAIFLVTSGEFMALYAANNILRGIRNFDGDVHARVAGIILNERKLESERERVERFARAVGLPICAVVPRSEAFAEAEERKRTVMELEGFEREKAVFRSLAGRICAGLTLYKANPLSDEDLEEIVLHGKEFSSPADAPSHAEEKSRPAVSLNKLKAEPDAPVPPKRPPLYGCAFNGAATTAIHLTDAVVVAHSPRSCAFYSWQNFSSAGRRNLFNRGVLLPSAVNPNFESTELNHDDVVFGGIDKLRERVRRVIERKPGAVVVVSSCVSGIIGDDVSTLEDLSTPEVPVIVVPADGDIAGDYVEGIRMSLRLIGEKLIDRSAPPRPMSVNLIGEMSVDNNKDLNFGILKRMLDAMGIAVNCRFLGDATVEEVRNLTAAPLNLLAFDSPDNRELRRWLEEEYGCRFLDQPLPMGFRDTGEFLRKIGEFFGCADRAEEAAGSEREAAMREIESLRPRLQGKKLLMSTINTDADWLLDAAELCGVEPVWIGVLNYLRQEIKVTADPKRSALVQEVSDWTSLARQIRERKPDIVLTNYTSEIPEGDYVVDNMTALQTVGFQSGLGALRRWTQLLERKKEGEWVRDRELFEKYFA